MSSGIAKYVELLIEVSAIIALLAIPCLTVLAYQSWSKQSRKELPSWRITLGTISIIITFVSWLEYAGSFLMIALGFGKHLNSAVSLGMMVLTLAIGIPLAIAIKGPARAQTLFAGLIMILLEWGSVNF
jgi:hypothetical protein